MKLSRVTAVASAVSLVVLLSSDALGQKKKKKKGDEEEVTQVLELPKEPPSAVTAETARLTFLTSPLSSKGLLSQQARDALRALMKEARGAAIVKLRGFVAGSGDVRRVQTIVSETFTERRLAIPALTVVQVGALPMEGAQVVLEAVAVARKEINPHGLVFISGQGQSTEKPLEPLGPLAGKVADNLETALRAASSQASDVSRVTCFVTALNDLPAIRKLMSGRFPKAAFTYVQTQRASGHSTVECEAVARLGTAPGSAVEFLNPEGLPKDGGHSQLVKVGTPRVAISGLQMAFGSEAGDAHLAFKRLEKALESVKASLKDVVMAGIYPLNTFMSERVRKTRFEFFDAARPPAATMLPFEGLPSMDASFGVDVVATVQ